MREETFVFHQEQKICINPAGTQVVPGFVTESNVRHNTALVTALWLCLCSASCKAQQNCFSNRSLNLFEKHQMREESLFRIKIKGNTSILLTLKWCMDLTQKVSNNTALLTALWLCLCSASCEHQQNRFSNRSLNLLEIGRCTLQLLGVLHEIREDALFFPIPRGEAAGNSCQNIHKNCEREKQLKEIQGEFHAKAEAKGEEVLEEHGKLKPKASR